MRNQKLLLFVRNLCLIAFVFASTQCAGKENTIQLVLSGQKFSIEVADTDALRQRGLMFRKNLREDQGMIFLFENDQRLSFWMKNTFVPLSIAFLAKDGTVKELHDMTPESLRPVESEASVRMALEVPKGTFDRLGIKPGDRINLPEEITNRLR